MATVKRSGQLDARLSEIAARLSKASSVKAGFPEGATYPDGTSIPMVAAIQEFGAPSKGIPPRPFMRTTVAEHGSEWPDVLIAALQANGYDAEKALGVLGETMRGEIQATIMDLNAPALSPVTVMLRGMRSQSRYRGKPFGSLISEAVRRVAAGKTNYGASTKPLEDTGEMVKSVVFRVD